jgi:hypothetical protein
VPFIFIRFTIMQFCASTSTRPTSTFSVAVNPILTIPLFIMPVVRPAAPGVALLQIVQKHPPPVRREPLQEVSKFPDSILEPRLPLCEIVGFAHVLPLPSNNRTVV